MNLTGALQIGVASISQLVDGFARAGLEAQPAGAALEALSRRALGAPHAGGTGASHDPAADSAPCDITAIRGIALGGLAPEDGR